MKIRTNESPRQHETVSGSFPNNVQLNRIEEDEIIARILERTGPGSLMDDLEKTPLVSERLQRMRLR